MTTEFLSSGTKITPMLKQWLAAKEKAKDAILLFRMGDFYELFSKDAEVAAPVLELALTARDKGENAVPMAGFPHQAAPAYIAKLIAAGFKVAICDQLEDPQVAKGIVKRDITRIVTPGTVLEEEALNNANNFLVGLFIDKNFGFAAFDLSTGDFFATQSPHLSIVFDELMRIKPSEIIWVGEENAMAELERLLSQSGLLQQCRLERRTFKGQKNHQLLSEYDAWFLESAHFTSLMACEIILAYVEELLGALPKHITSPRPYSLDGHLLIDGTTRRHLQLTGPKNDLRQPGTLLHIIDKTKTAMGGRALLEMLSAPLIACTEIEDRQSMVQDLVEAPDFRKALHGILKNVYDIERLTSRCASNRASPRDLGALKQSLASLSPLAYHLHYSSLSKDSLLFSLLHQMDPLEDVFSDLNTALADTLPHSLKEGGVFRVGYDELLNELVALSTGGRDKIAAIEQAEREKTGIGSLKIGYTRVFGYYIEVTKTHLSKVPAHYHRKQTIATGERYVTPELMALEEQVASAEVKRIARESELFETLCKKIQAGASRLLRTAKTIAYVDAIASLAEVADERRYVRPQILPKERRYLDLKGSRHPVVEVFSQASKQPFVPNDLQLNGDHQQILLITGPNMGGKSTIMRQAALIQVLAQMGSFVPADRAIVSVCDRIFARVGASDDLASGRSTFMVEMAETAHILRHSTPCSLILLDEIGRGTSTFDGLSLAWSVAEFLHNEIGARTLFATHYHELTELSLTCARIHNQHVAVSDNFNQLAFLYLLKEGAAQQSYGIHVAQLAGMPQQVLVRAEQLLQNLERSKVPKKNLISPSSLFSKEPQLNLFQEGSKNLT